MTVHDNAASLGPWRDAISANARSAWNAAPLARNRAVAIGMQFFFLRPKSASARKRPYMTVKRDVDKLARAVLDALTGIVYEDDAQVVVLTAAKDYVEQNRGVKIHVDAIR